MFTDNIMHTPIPGLHVMPTPAELEKSTEVYNALPDADNQRQVSVDDLEGILRLILANGVQEKFGAHLIHRHLQVGKGEVMLGKALTNSNVRGIWTRPTNFAGLDLNNIHGHIFALGTNGQFTAYEYHEGPPPAIEPDDNIFVAQLGKLLLERGLENLLGLQVLAGQGAKEMQEFDLSGSGPEGVVMLDAGDTKIDKAHRVTGWSAVANETTGVNELKGNNVHAPMQNGNHRVFQDSKLGDEKSLIDVLKLEGIINWG